MSDNIEGRKMIFHFQCRKCGEIFDYELKKWDIMLRLPLEDIHCPKCNWSPVEVFEEEEKKFKN